MVDLDYLVDVIADDRSIGLFGVTYVLNSKDFDAHKDNQVHFKTEMMMMLKWNDYWEFANDPQNPKNNGF